jgi:hypothetical protein
MRCINDDNVSIMMIKETFLLPYQFCFKMQSFWSGMCKIETLLHANGKEGRFNQDMTIHMQV